MEKNSTSFMIMETFIIIDMWCLMKIRQFIRQIVRLFIPLLKFFRYIVFIAGLFFIYAYFTQAKVFIENNRELFSKNNLTDSNKYLQIDENSQSNSIKLRKDLLKIKVEAMHLVKSLRKMNLQFKHLYEYQRNKDENLADFASEAIGGIVINTPDTQSYHKPNSIQITLFGIPIWRPNYYTPRKVIQPWTEAGECWAFRGSHGKIEIELAHAVLITHVTLQHIPASASITGKIDSAPKSFSVLGKVTYKYITIDTFLYRDKGSSSQIFEITKPTIKATPFKRIMLEILSNWGNANYTCVYRFKVHGKMYASNNLINANVP